MDFCESDAYASSYDSIRTVAAEFMQIQPYTIDANGKTVDSALRDALYHPNQKDSSAMFFEKLATSVLFHRNTYLLVWRRKGNKAFPGGQIRADNIAGFTFIENPIIEIRNGDLFYRVAPDIVYTEQEVIVIPGGVDANDLYAGYAPGTAAYRWATLDDYIAQFQKGLFANGGVPSGVLTITASSEKDYEDTVVALKRHHSGAGNNNNVTYSPRPIDPNTGNPGAPKIEWTPFAQTNKEIDFKAVADRVQDRLDTTYGVSQLMKGVDTDAKYSNGEFAEAGLAKRVVKPLALRVYTTITHELNRITGGLGVAISFKYEIPAQTDAEKVKAETRNIDADLILKLTTQDFSIDSIVDAFQLSNGYKLLKKGSGPAVIDNDKPDVDEGNEVLDSPDPKEATGAVNRTNPKALAKALTSNEKIVEVIAMDFMKAQVAKAVDDYEIENPQDVITGEFTEADLIRFVDELMVVLTSQAIVEGKIQLAEGKEIIEAIGLSTDNITDFTLSDAQINDYRGYLNQVGRSYGAETQTIIRSVLDTANTEGWTAAQIKKSLNEVPELNGYRAERLARTETVRAGGTGSLYSMEQITNQTGIEFKKIWNTSRSDACEFCRAKNGTTISLGQAFVPADGPMEGVDGGERINKFVDMDIAQAHPNCGCYLTYEVVAAPSVQASAEKSIHDISTGRYLGYKLNNGYAAIKGFKSTKDTIIKLGEQV